MKEKLLLSDFKFQVLNKDSKTDIDCENSDLNDFFRNDAWFYQSNLLAKTYCRYNKYNSPIAMVSLLNDSIDIKQKKKKLFNREKHLPSYPAVKIGRLGVDKDYKFRRLGSQILTFIRVFFVVKNKTGCRFITVDAYNKTEVLNFYERNKFQFITNTDKHNSTRSMFYDLMPFYNILIEMDKIDQYTDQISKTKY